MECPRCDGQGSLYKARILNLSIDVNICDECDACWIYDQPISIKNYLGLRFLLEKNGIEYKNLNMIYYCPFYPENFIDRAKIVGKNIKIYICESCNHIWNTKLIRQETAQNFVKYMQRIGLNGNRNELYDVHRLKSFEWDL